MSLLKRLSDGFWSYVSPRKPGIATKTTPNTLPRRKPAGAQNVRRASLGDIIRDDTSMDPIDRVDSWRDRSPSNTSKQRGRKRKHPSTPSTSSRGRPKKAKVVMEDNMDYTPSIGEEDVVMQDYVLEDDDKASSVSSLESNIRVDRSSPFQASTRHSNPGYEDIDSDIDVENTTLVVSEEEYARTSPATGKRKLISPTTEHFVRGVDTNDLRTAGWDDDHITLMQKLSMRGFEPLMPAYWKFDYSFMPDALFSQSDDDAFVSSVRGDHFRAIGAFEKLLEMGGRVRDRLIDEGKTGPEQQSCRQIRAFMRWAEADAQLYASTSIPVLAMVDAPADTRATQLQEAARKKCAKLAARWKEALRVTQSIEFSSSPGSGVKVRAGSTKTQLAYPIPTLYAIVASHTLVALTAYNPAATDGENGEPQVKSAAFFDMQDPAYDVWNSLAMAIIVCHVRNVQLRIAEDTGIGLRPGTPGARRSSSADPDA